MKENSFNLFDTVLGSFPVSRVRRNHGLEHATLHVLAERHPRTSLAGHSDLGGFWILGEVDLEDLQNAVDEALKRLQNGEEELAVHPNCGTNFVTAGTFAGVAASMAMFGARRFRDKLERIPLAASMATLALMLAQPVGLQVQERITTSGKPGDLQVVEIFASSRGRIKAHRVITRG
jgi:hypothetical protein